MPMTEDELLAKAERELLARIDAELAAKRAKERADIASRYRHQEAMAHLDRVNRRAPIEDRYSGLTAEQHAERLRQMDANRAAANRHMDAVQARVIDGSLVHQRKQAALTPGSEGFRVKG